MAKIVPTILATTPEEYQARLDSVTQTSKRIHVDITDGVFARNKTVSLAQVHVPDGVELDLHLMVNKPHDYLHSALSLKPSLIIVHAEALGDHSECAQDIQSMGVKAGIAYLQPTQPDAVAKRFDHALVFTGTLGHNGGEFDAPSLPKVQILRSLSPDIEVAVDGGINATNQQQVMAAGADVLDVGAAYEDLVS